MSILGFVSKLLKPEGPSDTRSTNPTTHTPQRAAAPQASTPAPAAFLQREEVLDEKNRIAGYRFRFTAAPDTPQNTEPLLIAELVSANIQQFAQRRLTIIPITSGTLIREEHLPLVAPNTLFQMDMQDYLQAADQLMPTLEKSTPAGINIALSNFTSLEDIKRLPRPVHTIMFDISHYSSMMLEALSEQIRHAAPGTSLLAEQVGSWGDRRMLGAWGFKYIIGGVTTAKDDEPSASEGKLDQSRLVVFEMLNILKSGGHDDELAEIAKRDPGITFKLLSMANSPAIGLKTPLNSISDAIKTLGRDAIYRWLTITMFRVGKTKDRDESLMEVALVRGRFMETLPGQQWNQQSRGELFLVGVLSVFEALLGLPMTKVMDMMQLSAPVRDVLIHNSGAYAAHLGLALAVEKGMTERIEKLSSQLQVSQESILTTSLAAMDWANQAKS